MECLKEFKDLLQNPLWEKGKHYVGLGNPNAEILIVGKECAVDENSDSYKCEYSQNYNLWKNRDWSIKVEDVKNWIDNPILDWKIFDPLAPYSGQRFAVERRNKNGEVISGKGGTSATWYKYQKLINFIRECGKLDSPVNTTHIDFYKDCFITELNELCRPNNHRLSAEERRKIEENICKKEIINFEIDLQEEIYNQRRKLYLIPNFFYKINLKKYQKNKDKVAENINSK